MRSRFLVGPACFIVLIGCVPIGGEAERLYTDNEKHAPDEGPSIQVTSVAVEPSTIYKDRKPDRATIFVQIMLRGEAPPKATARVDIATYSSDPPDNEVSYPEHSQTIPLNEKLVVAKFTVESIPRTVSGKVILAANIQEAAKGVNIKRPESTKDWLAELMINAP